jgi:hypothetical protein
MLPTEFIADYAQLLAGRRLGPGGALLHLEQLTQTGPLDAELEERRAQVDARKLPARDPDHASGAPARLPK